MAGAVVLYVAGYGRSGSTVLDLKLGRAFGFVSLGEVVSLYHEVARYPGARCGCGRDYWDCPLWGPVVAEGSPGRNAALMRAFQAPGLVGAGIRGWHALRHGEWLSREAFLAAVRRPLARADERFPGAVFVDSSKTAWLAARRPGVLAELGYRVAILHLRRPLGDTLVSVRAGDNKVLMGDRQRGKLLPVPRALAAYRAAHARAAALRGRFPYLEIFQPDLRDREEEVLARVFEFVTSHFGAGYLRYHEAHVVSGNRLKLAPAPAAPAGRKPI